MQARSYLTTASYRMVRVLITSVGPGTDGHTSFIRHLGAENTSEGTFTARYRHAVEGPGGVPGRSWVPFRDFFQGHPVASIGAEE
jgi:hypothetical protein